MCLDLISNQELHACCLPGHVLTGVFRLVSEQYHRGSSCHLVTHAHLEGGSHILVISVPHNFLRSFFLQSSLFLLYASAHPVSFYRISEAWNKP